jgi:hypothetical protein
MAAARPRSGLARGGLGAKLGVGACTIVRLNALVLVRVDGGERDIVGNGNGLMGSCDIIILSDYRDDMVRLTMVKPSRLVGSSQFW